MSRGAFLLALLTAATAAATTGARPLPDDGFIRTWRVGKHGVITQPGPGFELHTAVGKKLRPKRPIQLQTSVTIRTKTIIRLKSGCAATCEIRFAGRILQAGTAFRSFPDSREWDIEMSPGTHELVVTVKPKKRRHTLFLRIHDTSNGVPSDVSVGAPGERADRILVDQLPVIFETKVVGKQLQVTAIVGPASPTGATAQVTFGNQTASTSGERRTLKVEATGKRTELSIRSGEVSRTLRTRHRVHLGAIDAIAQARAALTRSTALGLQDALSTLRFGADHLEGLLARADKDTRFIESRVRTLLGQSDALNKGIDPLESERGVVMRAYESPLDGRDQVYAVYVPPSWQPGRSYPVVVSLHPSGFHPLLSLRSALGHAPSKGMSKRHATRHFPRIRDRHTFVVAPYGYRGTGSRYFGKSDVFEVLERIHRRYGTDRRRVTLSGGSLGGLGTWHIGLRTPDRFSSLMPMAGFGSVQHYKTVRGIRPTPWESFLITRRDNLTFVDNARYLPMLAIHGDRDNPRRSKIIVDAYRKRRFRHRFEELADTGHNAWDPGYAEARAFKFNRRHKTPTDPPSVDFVSGSYHHNKAYGLRIEQFEHHDALGRVAARVKRGALGITTDNVRRLTLNSYAALPTTIDGQSVRDTRPLTVERLDGHWNVTDSPIPAGQKQAGRSGPIDDVRYTPHVFVYGTQDSAETETNRTRAEHASRYQWNDAEIHMPVVSDTELSDVDQTSKNLILFGNPRSNSVVARMADRLPVRWTTNQITLGKQTFPGRSVGVSFIYPNPLTDGRTMVVIHAGATHRGTWLSAWLPRWVPDFVVYDEGIAVQRGGRLMDKRKPLAGGYFDRHWRLPSSYSIAP